MAPRHIAFALLAITATSAQAGPRQRAISWGKPGVSYTQYRKDAIECGHEAWYEDVSGTDAARIFKRASRQIEGNEITPSMEAAIQSARIIAGTRPELRMKEVRDLQYDVLGKCLSDRGYVRFRLTEVQDKKLRKMRVGSPERHKFLHALGSNGGVVTAQKI